MSGVRLRIGVKVVTCGTVWYISGGMLRIGDLKITNLSGRALAHRARDVTKALASGLAISADAVRVVRMAALQTCMIQ